MADKKGDVGVQKRRPGLVGSEPIALGAEER